MKKNEMKRDAMKKTIPSSLILGFWEGQSEQKIKKNKHKIKTHTDKPTPSILEF